MEKTTAQIKDDKMKLKKYFGGGEKVINIHHFDAFVSSKLAKHFEII